MRDPALWKQIQAFDFRISTDGRPFAETLAETHRWEKSFSVSVVEELKRFLYLTQVSGELLAPPRVVREAWDTFEECRESRDRLYTDVLRRAPVWTLLDARRPIQEEKCRYELARVLYLLEFEKRPPGSVWRTAWHSTMSALGVAVSLLSIAVSEVVPSSSHQYAAFAPIALMLAGSAMIVCFRNQKGRVSIIIG